MKTKTKCRCGNDKGPHSKICRSCFMKSTHKQLSRMYYSKEGDLLPKRTYKKQSVVALSMLFSLTLVLAQSVYPGQCYNLEFPNSDTVNINIISNTTPLEGFSWFQNGSTITYCLSADFPVQEFRVQWFNDNYVPIVKEIQINSGGSGGGTRTIEKIINKTVEVPKYIDRPIETIREIEKPIEVIKEVPIEGQGKTNKWWPVILAISLVIILVFGIAKLILNRNERRYKENGIPEYREEDFE